MRLQIAAIRFNSHANVGQGPGLSLGIKLERHARAVAQGLAQKIEWIGSAPKSVERDGRIDQEDGGSRSRLDPEPTKRRLLDHDGFTGQCDLSFRRQKIRPTMSSPRI